MAFGVIWHYWIGVVLFFATLVLVIAVVAGYFANVVRPKHPPKR